MGIAAKAVIFRRSRFEETTYEPKRSFGNSPPVSADRSNITTVYGCYVSDTGEVLARFSQSVGMMLDDEKEKVLGV